MQDLHLYFARFQGSSAVLGWMASQSNGKIVMGPDGQYYMANANQKPLAILGLDAAPTGAIGTNCTGTALGGGVKVFVWDDGSALTPGISCLMFH